MSAVCLLGVLVLAKLVSLLGHELPLSLWTPIACFWQDVLVALIFGGIAFWIRRPRVVWFFYGAIVLYVAANVPVVHVLSTPLTWPMLRATRGTLGDSIRYHITAENLGLMSLILATGIGLPLLLRRLELRRRTSAACLALAIVAVGPFASSRVEMAGLHRNALGALFASAFPRVSAQAARADWRAGPFENSEIEDLSRYRGAAAGRNVMLIILESTGARYLRPYGAAEDPMPNLTKLASQSVLFENAYAVYPESIKGLFAVLCSEYPAFDIPTETYGQIECASLARVLAQAGYRTALFHSGRFMYLGMDDVVQNCAFGIHEDAGDIGGNHNSSFGVDEPSTVRRILAWIDSLPKDQRFFVTYLPIAGHHPYVAPAGGPFSEDDDVGRYRNALHYGDASLGELIRGLQKRGLDQNTLFVIFGDHGEAFGQHDGNFAHTLFIYDENIQIPYLVVAPGIISQQERVTRVASVIDTAPTILDMLKLPIPQAYQGESLLEGKERVALFYTDYSLGFLGLRDRSWKYIYELESGRSKLFDVSKDPHEQRDLASSHPEPVAAYRDHVLRWSKSQKATILSLARP